MPLRSPHPSSDQPRRPTTAFAASLALLLASTNPLFAGPGSGQASFGGVEAQAELEIAKRMQLAEEYAPEAMQRGSVALMERDYETAYTQYKAAVDALPDAPNTRELRASALDGFSKSVMGLAESRSRKAVGRMRRKLSASSCNRNIIRITSRPSASSPASNLRTTSTRRSRRVLSPKLKK